MRTHEEIAAAQAAYAARPFAVRWCDSHFSGSFRFNTLDEAYGYINDQWRLIQRKCAHKSNGGSWIGSALWQSHLETPAGTVRLPYVMLVDDIDNRVRS